VLTATIPESRQGSAAIALPYVVRSTIGYHRNSWASCFRFQCQNALL